MKSEHGPPERRSEESVRRRQDGEPKAILPELPKYTFTEPETDADMSLAWDAEVSGRRRRRPDRDESLGLDRPRADANGNEQPLTRVRWGRRVAADEVGPPNRGPPREFGPTRRDRLYVPR